MKPAKTKDEIKKFYSSTDTSNKYIDKRFSSAVGRVMHERQVRFVNDAICKYSVKNILEFAPGPARVSADVTGFEKGTMVEVNENMLLIAKERLEKRGILKYWQLILSDVFEFTPKEKFGLVYTFRFIRHFDLEMRRRLYSNIGYCLNEGGFLIFDVPNIKVIQPIREKKGPGEIYDELYTKDQFIEEMEDNGYRVLKMASVWSHYSRIQYWIQIFLGPRWSQGAYFLIKLFENDNGKNPLEWIALCQKK
ncbi:MAG: class I SAM-dependent methyltransferase [Candidatus Omnitrophica bacterium]|nr:class I SAM-dependent methyltransferase [Candidatus Omnitrophota bacterium]